MSTTSAANDRWLFLLYLCDDYEQEDHETPSIGELLDRNDTLLEEIRGVEELDRLRTPVDVVYQFDSFLDINLRQFQAPDGRSRQTFDRPDQHCIRRYLKWRSGNHHASGWEVVRHASYKTIDTGRTQTLKEFFEWAKQPISDAAGIVVVFAGLGIGDKQSIVGNIDRESDYGRLFSICDDKSAKDALNPLEVQDALEVLVNDYRDGEPIDVLGFDMSSMQFIEVTYQFMGLARTVVASQNNDFDPFWPYADLLEQTAKVVRRKRGNGNYIGPADTGPMFVETIGRKLESVTREKLVAGRGHRDPQGSMIRDERPIITAIDVGQLDVATRSMDTLFLNLLQSLGDEAIWNMRDAVFRDLKKFHRDSAKRNRLSRSVIAFDLRHMLLLIRKHLRNICNAQGVLQAWCSEQLRELYDPDADDPLYDRKTHSQQDEHCGVDDHACREKEARKQLRDRVSDFLLDRMDEQTGEGNDACSDQSAKASRLWRQLQLITFDDQLNVYCPKLDDFERSHSMADLPNYPQSAEDQFLFHSDLDAASLSEEEQEFFNEAKAFLHQLKERFDRLASEQLDRSAQTAQHLCSITDDVLSLVSPPPLCPQSNLQGLRKQSVATAESEHARQRCILAQYACGDSTEADECQGQADELDGLPKPRQCGISIYRPEHLDRLAESQYLDFSFHRRVHWVSLLAAVNLIRKHAGQLWNLVSSLLSTCTGAGRDELLQRLAGPSSVMDRFGKQFQALQNPLTLTLTVGEENPNDGQDERSGEEGQQNGSQQNEGLFYKLTLETNLQDAVADVSRSSLNRQRADRAIERLETVIDPGQNRGRFGLDSMESYARDLGEDIFQGIDLEQHRRGGDSIPHLQLQLPIELMGLPWEVMNDGHGGLCERFAMSRQALIEAGTARPIGTRNSTKIRILIIGDPILSDSVRQTYGAEQLSGAVDEALEVERLFRDLKRNLPGTVDLQESDVFVHKKVTGHDVRQLIRSCRYDIIHFAGHAMHNEQASGRSSWLMSDGELHAQEIANTLTNISSRPWLVYANACESAMSSSTERNVRTERTSTGWARHSRTTGSPPIWDRYGRLATMSLGRWRPTFTRACCWNGRQSVSHSSSPSEMRNRDWKELWPATFRGRE